jgi:acyl-CoA thioester hydrolase
MMAAYVSESRLRVRYAETDAQGIVYYANYFVWFEVGRVNYLREVGFDIRRREQDGITFVIAEARCKYHASARFDDPILIRTWISRVKTHSFEFAYAVYHEEQNELLAEGSTVQVVIDPTTFEPAPLQAELREQLLTVGAPAK